MQKLAIDAGFTCPNRDGTLARGGCTYCDNRSFNPSYCTPRKTITQQIEEGIEFHARRYRRAEKFLAYFQAYSNTYAPLDKLREIYDEALRHPLLAGIVIGTRPDCVDEEKLDLLAELRRTKYVAVEYGVESCYDKSLQRINRMHDFAASRRAIERTASRNIVTGAHFIFGLPGESKEEMLAQTEILSALPVDTVKFHQLQILKNTKMAEEYKNRPEDFHEFTVPEYIDFICDFVERLSPHIVVERIAGEVPPRYLAAPAWCSLRNDQLLSLFEKRLEERDTRQGKLYANRLPDRRIPYHSD